jgi:predicted regulator of amino acid metabolism with ACT domain
MSIVFARIKKKVNKYCLNHCLNGLMSVSIFLNFKPMKKMEFVTSKLGFDFYEILFPQKHEPATSEEIIHNSFGKVHNTKERFSSERPERSTD